MALFHGHEVRWLVYVKGCEHPDGSLQDISTVGDAIKGMRSVGWLISQSASLQDISTVDDDINGMKSVWWSMSKVASLQKVCDAIKGIKYVCWLMSKGENTQTIHYKTSGQLILPKV